MLLVLPLLLLAPEEEEAVEVERPKESLDLKVMEVKKSEELGLNDAQKKQKKKRATKRHTRSRMMTWTRRLQFHTGKQEK